MTFELAFYLVGLLWLWIAFFVLDNADKKLEWARQERQKALDRYEAGMTALLEYADVLELGISREEIDEAFGMIDGESE